MRARKNPIRRVLRGGCFISGAGFRRVTVRIRYMPVNRNWDVGFRFVVRGQK